MSINSPRLLWVERRKRSLSHNPFAFRPGQRASDIAASRDSCIPESPDASEPNLWSMGQRDPQQPDQHGRD
jgi:hypothetical protein